MIHLHIEHKVADFNTWKAAFDSDPVGRERSGVKRYRILRPVNDPNFAIIELEFERREQAEGLLAAMQQVWGRVNGTLIDGPVWRVTELVDEGVY